MQTTPQNMPVSKQHEPLHPNNPLCLYERICSVCTSLLVYSLPTISLSFAVHISNVLVDTSHHFICNAIHVLFNKDFIESQYMLSNRSDKMLFMPIAMSSDKPCTDVIFCINNIFLYI